MDPGAKRTYRLYSGATYDHPYHGLYSYFPCSPYRESDESGFARPAVQIKGIITDNLTQGTRMNPQSRIEDVVKLWTEATRQITEQGFCLGIRAELPTPD